ncbi:ImuA family protein [Dyadobacter sp.]|uniref:ImuA family protein n=1 Tax=Dyadobacter sp. TaxID=1914288 RepID=UPI003F6ED4FC
MEQYVRAAEKKALLERLRSEMMSLQGVSVPDAGRRVEHIGLGSIENAFPHDVFPRVGMHEFTSYAPEEASATSGFIAAISGRLMKQDGICAWVSTKRTIYPLALSQFGVAPDRVIFIDLKKEKDLLWTIEEALKCKGLSCVIGEIKDLNLTESRRLQLAVEDSRVTGFLHRVSPRTKNAISSLCRWRIKPMPSGGQELRLPGLGYPTWQVRIEKVRNGRPGKWLIQWRDNHFEHIDTAEFTTSTLHSKVG